jgi:hypothetical protein
MSIPAFLGSSEYVNPPLRSTGVSMRERRDVGPSLTHHTVVPDAAEASTGRPRNEILCLGMGPTQIVSRAYTIGIAGRRTGDEADLLVISIPCGFELLLCVLQSFRDVKAMEVNCPFGKRLA